jgi:hypothetical protein
MSHDYVHKQEKDNTPHLTFVLTTRLLTNCNPIPREDAFTTNTASVSEFLLYELLSWSPGVVNLISGNTE